MTRGELDRITRPAPKPIGDTYTGKTVVLLAKSGSRAGRAYWRNRVGLAPTSIALALTAVGSMLSLTSATTAGLAWAGAAACTGTVVAGHRKLRRRQGQPLTPSQKLSVNAAAVAGLSVLALNAVDGPAHTLIGVGTGVITVTGQTMWWLRPSNKAAAEVGPETDTDEPLVDGGDGESDWRSAVWARRVVPTVIVDSALTDVAEINGADGRPNGFEGIVRLNLGGPIRHTASSLTSDIVTKIALAFGADPANVVIQPSRTDRVPIIIFDRNPLQGTPEWPGPIQAGTFRHQLGNSVIGDPVLHDIFVPGFGSIHGMVIGATGSGKSEAMLTLLNMERHTLDAAGHPLIASVLLDPQGGSSFPDFAGDGVAVFAHHPSDIADVLDWLVSEMTWRTNEMRERRWKVWQPSAAEPLLAVTQDEWMVLLKMVPRRMVPRLAKPMTVLANGGRKAGIGVKIGSQYPSLEDSGDDGALRDALASGYVLLGRVANKQSAPMASGGRLVGNPVLLPERFEDGSMAAGVMYYLGGTTPAGVMIRTHMAGPRWARTGTVCQYDLGRHAVHEEAEEEADTAAASNVVQMPRDTAETTGSIAQRAATWLKQIGRVATTGEISDVLKVPAERQNAVSQALARDAQRGGDVADAGYGRWIHRSYLSLLATS